MKISRNRFGSESGIIALDALLSLIILMFFMFFLYSFMIMFMAQNMIGHAMLETGQSLALESYGIAKLNDGKMQVADIARRIVQTVTDSDSVEGEELFYTHTRWFDNTDSPAATTNHDINDMSVLERRFKAYLGGNPEKADKILSALRVENFSLSESKLNGQDLDIVVTYDINLMFGFTVGSTGLGKYSVKQQTSTRLWGKHPTKWWLE